jgi:cardiolipin synthase
MYDFLAIFSIAVLAFLLFLILFERGLNYTVKAPGFALESPEYLCLLGTLSDAQIHRHSRVEVLTNGDHFYAAELEAICSARRCINLEAYIFAKGDTSRRFIDALAERARAGVKVKLVLDTIGSFTTWDRYFKPLRDAGGEVRWYQPIRWYTFKRMNNRTHRELLIVDGTVGFIGGAGIADCWSREVDGEPQWRDTVCRVTGALVSGLQSCFADNWLESSEEILAGDDYFPPCRTIGLEDAPARAQSPDAAAEPAEAPAGPTSAGAATTAGFVVISAPSAGRSSRARILFQTLLASATQSILINSPYFMPDRSARAELARAAGRGVDVKIITPGEHADHLLTRRSSRRRYGELLKAGAAIHEYQPSMIHAKILVIDGIWSVVGSTNFDNRSFGLNDEVNLAAQCPILAARLTEDFNRDLQQARRISYDEWSRRPLRERIVEWIGRLLERQQ